MNEKQVVKRRSGVLERIDGMFRGYRGKTAAVLASLALGGGVAEAQASGAHAGKPKQAQEFVTVKASDAGGDPLGTQKRTFLFVEKCKEDSRPVTRRVIYSRPNQPLGKCDANGSVTVIEKQPLQGEWVHRSGIKQTHRAKNNHFGFIEQRSGVFEPQPAPAPTPSPEPTPAPTPTPAPETDPYASGNVGVDVSWPQCGTANETPSGFDFGIVGVTNGLSYSTNPCLGSEAANFPGDELNLYVNTGWYSASSHINPDSPRACATGDENCLAYNYGYNAGLYAVGAATGAGIDVATRWWLDVESDASWATDTTQNRNSLQGQYDALAASGATEVGAYSTTVQWNDITGNWHNSWQSWGATTWQTAQEAATYCTGHEFTGGPSRLMQYLPTTELDYNVAC